ncbi:TetR/AcrR family transcriptional regulator [Glycomyces tenuis]|uniref:TetR/AcrR family transcriptional regulator n=1 Tax=Glycomyces tenuis TaxID=58116 RepID=UPI0004091495|nr:TetR/AcrR family transcriptional regulator [Glycomyces tenuis]
MESDAPSSRSERRRRTERRILAAAGRLFAERGYEKTTIRAVAAEAETDPGLVMRYFGSKDALFARVTEIEPDEPPQGGPDEIAEVLLRSLGDKLRTRQTGTEAMLRSMLTHPAAAEEIRATLAEQQHRIAEAIPGDEGHLRAALIGAATLGTVLGRDLLRLEGLSGADPDRILSVLRPAFHALAHGEAEQE